MHINEIGTKNFLVIGEVEKEKSVKNIHNALIIWLWNEQYFFLRKNKKPAPVDGYIP